MYFIADYDSSEDDSDKESASDSENKEIGRRVVPSCQSANLLKNKGNIIEEYISDSGNNEMGPAVPPRYHDSADEIGPPIPPQYLDSGTDEIGPPIPPQYHDSGTDEIGPPIPPQYQSSDLVENLSKIRTSSDESEDESEDYKLPISYYVEFKHGSKPITALAVDPTGTRFATGSVDYEVKFWDFVGMNHTLQSFRSLYPCGNYPIKSLAYSNTGDTLLVISGMSQAKVLDRDGHEKLECVKGDQYISDMAQTKGHTSPLTDGCWNPRIREEFLTSSEDSTLRLWNVNTSTHHKSIIKCRSKNGLKTIPTTVEFNRDASLIACVCQDGSFALWDTRKMFVNATKMIRDAHQNGTDTSRIAFSYSKNLVSTRGGDGTLKLWDLRMFKKAVKTVDHLFSRYGSTDCMFNPQDNVVITGVSIDRDEKDGKLLFFDVRTFEKVEELIVTNSHVIKSQWHPRLQQIFVGCGNGIVKLYYGDESIKGAKLCAKKKPVKSKQMEAVAYQQIITPHALPLFRQDRQKSVRKQMEKDRLDPVKSRRPDLPIKSGQGGRVAATGSTLSSYVIRNMGLSKRVEDDQDPREAILKYAKEAAENPYWVSPAYAKTQPKTIFRTDETENGEPLEKKKKS